MSVFYHNPATVDQTHFTHRSICFFMEEIYPPSLTYICFYHSLSSFSYLGYLAFIPNLSLYCFHEGITVSHRPRWPSPITHLSGCKDIFSLICCFVSLMTYALLFSQLGVQKGVRSSCSVEHCLIQLKSRLLQVHMCKLHACGNTVGISNLFFLIVLLLRSHRFPYPIIANLCYCQIMACSWTGRISP